MFDLILGRNSSLSSYWRLSETECSSDVQLSPMATSEPQSDSHKTPTGESTRGEEQITIFYNGQVFVCDVTEFQARAIILLAAREMEGRDRSMWSSAALLALHSQIYGPPGVSLKRSLQSFLQRRKQRSRAASPYNNSTNNL